MMPCESTEDVSNKVNEERGYCRGNDTININFYSLHMIAAQKAHVISREKILCNLRNENQRHLPIPSNLHLRCVRTKELNIGIWVIQERNNQSPGLRSLLNTK